MEGKRHCSSVHGSGHLVWYYLLHSYRT